MKRGGCVMLAMMGWGCSADPTQAKPDLETSPTSPATTAPVTETDPPTETSCALDLDPGPALPTGCPATLTSTVVRPAEGPYQAPLFGPLTDDDGDGRFSGPGEVPEWVLEPSMYYFDLRILSGLAAPPFDLQGQFSFGPFIADVNGDAVPDLVALHVVEGPPPGYRLEVYDDLDTLVVASSETLPFQDGGIGFGTAGDLDGDGTIEVVFPPYVLDGQTGALERTLQLAGPGFSAFLVDLDGDGGLEIVCGAQVFGADARELWDAGLPWKGQDGYSLPIEALPVELDGDPNPELAFYSEGALHRFDGDGTPIDVVTLPISGGSSPPCVADFDGDGAPELALPAVDGIEVVETDGTLVWQVAAEGAAFCAGADLDLDGAVDLIGGGEDGFAVYSGPTGAPLVQIPELVVSETPAVVDVNGDGDAEVVVSSRDLTAGGLRGYTVLDQPGWPGVGDQWSMTDFSEARLDEDGGVGPGAVGQLRSRATVDLGAEAVTAELVDACPSACAQGLADVAIRLDDRGDTVADATVEVMGVAADGSERVVGTATATLTAGSNTAVAATVDVTGVVELYARAAPSTCDSPGTRIPNPCP